MDMYKYFADKFMSEEKFSLTMSLVFLDEDNRHRYKSVVNFDTTDQHLSNFIKNHGAELTSEELEMAVVGALYNVGYDHFFFDVKSREDGQIYFRRPFVGSSYHFKMYVYTPEEIGNKRILVYDSDSKRSDYSFWWTYDKYENSPENTTGHHIAQERLQFLA